MSKPIKRVFDERGRCLLCGADAKGDLSHEHAGHEVKSEQLRLRRLIGLQRAWFEKSHAVLRMIVSGDVDVVRARDSANEALAEAVDLKRAMKEDSER